MTEQECRALFFRESYTLASVEHEAYRGFKLGMKIQREMCIEDVRTIGGEFAIECEKLIRARSE